MLKPELNYYLLYIICSVLAFSYYCACTNSQITDYFPDLQQRCTIKGYKFLPFTPQKPICIFAFEGKNLRGPLKSFDTLVCNWKLAGSLEHWIEMIMYLNTMKYITILFWTSSHKIEGFQWNVFSFTLKVGIELILAALIKTSQMMIKTVQAVCSLCKDMNDKCSYSMHTT